MHFTLLLAGALLPARLALALSSSLETPNLKARLSNAALIENAARSSGTAAKSGNAHLDWLAKHLFSHDHPAATAPYALARISGATPRACVWHADAVHVEAARDHLIVQSLDAESLTADESAELIGVANELLAGGGCELVTSGDRWFLLNEHDWKIDAPPLSMASGASVEMPTGHDAQVWSRMHNEIQMAWHAHSVNRARDARGSRTVNAIWLHGGGRWKPLPAIAFAQVQCHAAEWQGAAEAAGSRACPLDAALVDGALLVIDDLVTPRRQEDWSAWLRRMAAIDLKLAACAGASIDLVNAGSTIKTFASRPSDRYKPWRRRLLAEALTE